MEAQSGENKFVHLVYLDDSQANEDCRFHLMGGIIVSDKQYPVLEQYLSWLVEQVIPEDLRDSFEFHAKDLFHRTGIFQKLTQEAMFGLFKSTLNGIRGMKVPVIYGAVDARKLRSSIHASASPADVSFRLCIPEVERWFTEKADHELGIVICDDTTNAQQKRQFQSAFRCGRPKIRMMLDSDRKIIEERRGPYEHLHDDMYFGSSGNSIGIQMADMCCFVIHRHLEGKTDTEDLYKEIKDDIFAGKVE